MCDRAASSSSAPRIPLRMHWAGRACTVLKDGALTIVPLRRQTVRVHLPAADAASQAFVLQHAMHIRTHM